MSGQIHERFYNDSSKASEFYFRIINDYPESIFSEQGNKIIANFLKIVNEH